MNTPLPLLPFVSKEESIAYAKYVLNSDEGQDFNAAAEDFLRYVDGVNVMPKLPSHMSTYAETWSRNKRVLEREKKSKGGREKLEELNKILSPQGGKECDLQEPQLPSTLPQCTVEAMDHNKSHIVGGVFVGENPLDNVVGKKRKRRTYRCGVCGKTGCKGVGFNRLCPDRIAEALAANRQLIPDNTQQEKQYKRQCSVCRSYGPPGLNCGIGGNNKKNCRIFTVKGDTKCRLCVDYGPVGSNCEVGGVNVKDCKYFEVDGTKK